MDKIEILLLLALPASGKSEIRRFLEFTSEDELSKRFNLLPTIQLDDFHYVNFMRRIDEELISLGKDRIFFKSETSSFCNPQEWGVLIELLNEDFEYLFKASPLVPKSFSFYLFERIDIASSKVGIKPRLCFLDDRIRNDISTKLEEEAINIWRERRKYSETKNPYKTIILEFSRGGPDGARMPLKDCYGYEYSLKMLSDKILEKAAILYILVTPDQARKKNMERMVPGKEGSILFHGVPLEVMFNDYGCDDFEWLLNNSEKEGFVTIEKNTKRYYLPAIIFDNRDDKTSFLRQDRSLWPPNKVRELGMELERIFKSLSQKKLEYA